MSFLVVYYSHTNNNQKIAQLVKQKLNCDVLRIEELKRRNAFTILLDLMFNRYPAIKTDVFSLKNYKHVIFIAPVWASRIASPMRTFLRNEKKNIGRYSFITLCGGYAGQHSKVERDLQSLVGKAADDVLELWVNDLLPREKKDKIRYVTNYRVKDNDLINFESKIDRFLMTENLLLSYLSH